jgi:hypothetical protein
MPASEAPRHALADVLSPLLPAAWKIVPYQRNLDTLDTTIVMFKQAAIRPLPAAPIRLLQVDMTITVISARSDLPRAEDELDDDTLALCVALDELGILWTEANKVLWNDQHLAWDIAVQLEASKTRPTPITLAKEGNPHG